MLRIPQILTYPLMAFFLNLGVFPFITTKLLLTCTPVLIFLVFHNRYFRLLHIHVKALIPAFAAAAFLLVLLWTGHDGGVQ